MVENIYRHLAAGEYAELPLKERILRACRRNRTRLLFSTLIMVCAFMPLFTMSGPEGQLFGPMADTYAFALGGALLLAVIAGARAVPVVLQEPQAGRRQLPGPLPQEALPLAAGASA